MSEPDALGLIRGTARRNLRQLVLMRYIGLTGQLLTVVTVEFVLGQDMPITTVSLAWALMVLVNLATTWRLSRPWPVSANELLAQLMLDVLQLTVVLHLTGGETNPFAGYLLLPLAVGAAILPLRHTFVVAATTAACSTLLTLVSEHIRPRGYQGDFIRLLEYGSWISYLSLSAMLVLAVVKLTQIWREHEQRLAEAREQAIRGELVSRIGALAAGAAHELSSPLTAIGVSVTTLREHGADPKELEETLDMLAEQIQACRATLAGMLAYARREASPQEDPSMPAGEWVALQLARWQALRPGAQAALRRKGATPGPVIAPPAALGHAVLNLLNNAADASPQGVELEADWSSGTEFVLAVCDRGPGFPAELQAWFGQPFQSSKGDRGFGIGLLLVKTCMDQLGGRVAIGNRAEGGARVELRLPLSRLETAAASRNP